MKATDRPVTVFWFRRDLRLQDNHGLFQALQQSMPVLPVFIFDKDILDKLPHKRDKRVAFIHQTVCNLSAELAQHGSSLYVSFDRPLDAFEKIISVFNVKGVFTNHDYEPYAIERDNAVKDLLKARGICFHSFKDQVIFERSEVMKPDGLPYTVFTPYSTAWKRRLQMTIPAPYPSEAHLSHLARVKPFPIPSLEELGFEKIESGFHPIRIEASFIRQYSNTRDHPSIAGTSFAGPHLRFGTVSIRTLVRLAMQRSETWLNELIWREFFMMILFHHPYVVDRCFKKQYELIRWQNSEPEFDRWCKGETGYAMVDAGMRQLNATGWMHNRVRMIAAGFLTKHLLIDWRWGEAYFAEKLMDYELSSNNGNWQWAAGCGCDAAPYFRIFNPETQRNKFDPDEQYVRTWIPDYRPGYLPPIVDHKFARDRALKVFKGSLERR